MGLGAEQLAARKTYKTADQDVQRAIDNENLAKQAILDAQAELEEAKRQTRAAVVRRGAALNDCRRLGIDP